MSKYIILMMNKLWSVVQKRINFMDTFADGITIVLYPKIVIAVLEITVGHLKLSNQILKMSAQFHIILRQGDLTIFLTSTC